MGRKRVKGTKYNKISKQQKYLFIKLCLTDQKSLQEAAFEAGIHYSTAKTILFFHKKHYKNYTQFQVPQNLPQASTLRRATYAPISINVDCSMKPPPISIFSTINKGGRLIKKSNSSSSTEEVKQQQFSYDFVKLENCCEKGNQEIQFLKMSQGQGSMMEEWRKNEEEQKLVRND